MSDFHIRPVTDADLTALSAFSRQTFSETFVDGFGIAYPQADLDVFFAESFSEAALAKRIHDPECIFWLAEREGEIIGLCHAGPNGLSHPLAKDGEMELRRLYVAKSAQGLGLGTELLKRALTWMEQHTTGALWLGVWSGNLKAQKLYGAYGFEKVGEYQYPVGQWLDDEFILRRA